MDINSLSPCLDYVATVIPRFQVSGIDISPYLRLPNSPQVSQFTIIANKMSLPQLQIDWHDRNMWIATATIVFNPLYWNIVARREYHHGSLSRWFPSRRLACQLLAASIFLLGVFRDFRFSQAMSSQPEWPPLQQNWVLGAGYLCMGLGTVLVLTSFFSPGFYGTFLGDYFGILMEKRVTGFPFNVLDNPMYVGSTLNFLGGALLKASQCGLLLTVLVAMVYQVAVLFEGPFTTKIYAEKSGHRSSKKYP